ncbi:MAG: helical backbone metal receptor, partial [Dehalococcoidia bacterium]
MRRRVSALLALTLLVVTTCRAEALTLRDMLGRDVTVATAPVRIVSLVPSVTEVMFALGAQDRLVGRTDYCDYPPAAASRPSVGGMINPSLERIVSLKPDLVVATDEGNREETIQQLRRVGLPVYLVHATRVSEMLQMIERVGEVTGRQAAVPALVA